MYGLYAMNIYRWNFAAILSYVIMVVKVVLGKCARLLYKKKNYFCASSRKQFLLGKSSIEEKRKHV